MNFIFMKEKYLDFVEKIKHYAPITLLYLKHKKFTQLAQLNASHKIG
jgi:hypothetical protein